MLLRYTWPAITWSVFILVITLIPGDALPPSDLFQIDKVVHFIVFGVLMIVSAYALLRNFAVKGSPAKPMSIAIVYSLGFGAMIEVLQLFVPGRSFSLLDILANSIGVGLGYLVILFFQKRKLV
jgi:VanZ family protein